MKYLFTNAGFIYRSMKVQGLKSCRLLKEFFPIRILDIAFYRVCSRSFKILQWSIDHDAKCPDIETSLRRLLMESDFDTCNFINN